MPPVTIATWPPRPNNSARKEPEEATQINFRSLSHSPSQGSARERAEGSVRRLTCAASPRGGRSGVKKLKGLLWPAPLPLSSQGDAVQSVNDLSPSRGTRRS